MCYTWFAREGALVMTEQDRELHLIEHILTLLNLLQANNITIDQLTASDGHFHLSELTSAQEIHTAYEFIKFMNEMPGGFLIYYADGDEKIIYANKSLRWIFRCDTMKEFQVYTGNTFKGMVHPDDWQAVKHSIQTQLVQSQYKLDYVEYRIVRKDGEIRWIEDYGHFVHSETVGDIFYVFLSDATEKKHQLLTEKALLVDERRKNEQRLQNLIQEYNREKALMNQEQLRRLEVIEGLSVNYDSIFYVDLYKNKIFPYRLSERNSFLFEAKFQPRDYDWYSTQYLDAWVHPEDRERVEQATDPVYIRERLATSKTYYVNYRVLFGDQTQYLQLRFVNVRPDEPASQIVIGYRRVDEELQYEMEQKQMLAKALDNANLSIVAKDTFLSNMSHDMRTPLNAIFGFITLAKKNLLNPEVAQSYLNRIETSSRQLLDMIDKVLELSWTDSNEEQSNENECDLCDIVQEIYDFLLPQALEKDIEFLLDSTQIRHSGVYGDQDKIKQVVLYLANNAITYTKPNGKVSITISEKESRPQCYAVYQLIIQDTGIGISEEFLERIFEPFTREKNTTLSGIHGIGLGLTIAKNIVDSMGGTIEVKSVVNKGSTFTVTLRLRVQNSTASTNPNMEELSLKNQKILLVEDNEINLEIETEILQDLGFSIDTATDGSIAVEKVRNSVPGEHDLILMDIQMPVMDGWQATRAIRELENPALACIPIIALSANALESDRKKSIESGMDAHLKKPIDIPSLLNTIGDVMQKYH